MTEATKSNWTMTGVGMMRFRAQSAEADAARLADALETVDEWWERESQYMKIADTAYGEPLEAAMVALQEHRYGQPYLRMKVAAREALLQHKEMGDES